MPNTSMRTDTSGATAMYTAKGRLDANAKGAIRLAIFDTQADIVSDVKDKPRKRRPSPNGRQSQ